MPPEPLNPVPGTLAVLMGDIVGSESAPSMERLHWVFNAAINEANDRNGDAIASPLTITLGDEFQGLCRSLSDGLRTMQWLRHKLLAAEVECRFALGVVRIVTPLRRDRAWNMMGPGLAATREKLSDKRHPNAYRFHFPGDPAAETVLEALGYAATLAERDWSEKHRKLVLDPDVKRLHPKDQAAALGVTPRNIYKMRISARLDYYDSLWTALAEGVEVLDQRYGLA